MPTYEIDGYGLVDAPDGMQPDAIVGALRQNDKAFDARVRRSQKGLPSARDIMSELDPENLEQFNRQQEADLARQDEPSLIGRMTGGDDSFMKRMGAGAVDLIRAPFALRSGLRMGPHNVETAVAQGISDYLKDIPSGLRMRPEVNTSRTFGGLVRSGIDAIKNPSVESIGGAYADVAQFGIDAIAENAPQLLLGFGAVGILGKLGASAELATRLAPIITTFPQEASNALEQYAAAGQTGVMAKIAALTVGLANAGLEGIGDTKLLRRMLPEASRDPTTLARTVGREIMNALKQSGIEAATEGAQKITTQSGETYLTGKLPDPKQFGEELLTEMTAGGMAGGGTSSAVSVADAIGTSREDARQDREKDARLERRANLMASGLRLDGGQVSRETGIRYAPTREAPSVTFPYVPVGEPEIGPRRKSYLDSFDTDLGIREPGPDPSILPGPVEIATSARGRRASDAVRRGIDTFDLDAGLRTSGPSPSGIDLVDMALRAEAARSSAESGLAEAPPPISGETTPVDQLLRRGQGARRRASVAGGMIGPTQEGGDVREGQVQAEEQEEVAAPPTFPPDPNQPPPPSPVRIGVPELESKWSKDEADRRAFDQARAWLGLSVDTATGVDALGSAPVAVVQAPVGRDGNVVDFERDPISVIDQVRDALKRIGGYSDEKVSTPDGKTKSFRPTRNQKPRGRVALRDMETGDIVVLPAYYSSDKSNDPSRVVDESGKPKSLRKLLLESRTSRNMPRYVPFAIYPQIRERADRGVERFSGTHASAFMDALPTITGTGRTKGSGRRKGGAGQGGGASVGPATATQDASDMAVEPVEDDISQGSALDDQEKTPDNRLRIAASRTLKLHGIKPGVKLTPEQSMSAARNSLQIVSNDQNEARQIQYLRRWYPGIISKAEEMVDPSRLTGKPEQDGAYAKQLIMEALAREIAAMHESGTLADPNEIEWSVLYAPNEISESAKSAERIAKTVASEGIVPDHLRGGNSWNNGVGVIFHATTQDAPVPSGVISRGLYGFTSPSLTFWRSAEQKETGSTPAIYKIIANPYEIGTSPDLFVRPGSRLVEVPGGRFVQSVDGQSVPVITLITDGAIRTSGSVDAFLSPPPTPPQIQQPQSGPRDTESILYGLQLGTEDEASVVRAISQKLGGVTTYVQPDAEFDLNPDNAGRIAYYDPRNHRIVVRQSAAGQMGQPFLHEAVHAATVRGLVEDREFRSEIEKLQREARELLGVGTYGTQAGLSRTANLAEFVAEVLSNPEFRAQLDQARTGKKKSIWQRFIDALAKIFGFNRTQRTFLEQVLSATNRSMVDGGRVQNLDPLATRYPKAESVRSALANPMAQTPEAQATIEREASAQADLVEAAVDPYRNRIAELQSGTAHERAVGRLFEKLARWLPDQANAMRDASRMATTPLLTISGILSGMTPAQRADSIKPYQQAAVDVLDLRHAIRVKRERNEEAIQALRLKIDKFIKTKLPKQRGAELLKAYLGSASETAISRYSDYLAARQKVSPNLTQREQKLHMDAVNRLAGVRQAVGGPASQIAKALDLIAGSMTMQELDAIQTLPDLEGAVFTRGILLGPEAQRQGIGRPVAEFLANHEGTGALKNMGNILEVLKRLRGFQENAVQYDQEVDDFESWWRSVAHGAQGANKKVTVSEFVGKILAMDRQKQRVAQMLRDMNREFDLLDRLMRARVEYRNLIDTVLASPHYNRTLDGAQEIAGALGFIESGRKAQTFGSQDSSVIPFQEHRVGDQLFKIRWDLEENVEEENWREVGRMVQAIQHELTSNQSLDPVQRAGYLNLLRNAESYYRVHGGTTLTGATQTGPLDLINLITDVMPVVNMLKTRGDITRKLPGRIMLDLIRSQQAVNAVSLGLRGVANHPVHGSKRQAEAEAAAISSHPGMTPDQWNREVFEPLLSEGQRFDRRNPEAGRKSRFGHAYTSQDIKAAKLQSSYVEHAMRVIQGQESRSGIVLSNPVLIEDKESGLARRGSTTGPTVMPRGFRRGSSQDPNTVDYLDRMWRDASSSDDQAVMRAARIALLEGDDTFFGDVAIAYVWEQNPEFKKVALLRQAMDSLSVEWHDDPSRIPSSWGDLVSAVTDRHNDIEIARATDDKPANILDATTVEDAMLDAFDKVFQAYRSANSMAEPLSQLGMSEEALGDLANKDVLISIASAESSFTLPRDRMVAPSSFYRYGIPTTGQKAGVLAAAMAPFRMRELSLMKIAMRAIADRHNEMGRTIASIPRSEWTKRTKAGREYADYQQLGRLRNQLAQAVKFYEDSITGVASSLQEESMLDAFLSADRALLLASPTAALSNVLSAISLGSSMPSMLMGQSGRAMRRAALNLVTGVPRLIMGALAGTQHGRWLRQNMKDLPWGVRHFASKLQQIAEFHRLALENNIIAPRIPLSEQVKIARDVGSVSFEAPVLGQGRDPGSWRRRISRWVASHPVVSYPYLGLAQISQLGDELGNTLAYESDERNLRYYMAALYAIMQNRYDAHGGGSAGEAAIDPNQIENRIKPEEFNSVGMASEDVRTAGQLFAAAGGIERAAYSYWKRASAASPEDRPNVPMFESPSVEADVRRAVQMTTNLAADSNRPDAMRNPNSPLGKALSTIFTFVGWTSGWFSTIGQAMQASTGRGSRYGVSSLARGLKVAAILMVMLAMLGAETPELRNLITRYLMNREPTSVSISTVLNDPSPENVTRGLATAIASTLPYAGEYLADAAGAPTYRASALDVTRMSRTLSMAAGLKDAVEYGLKTGDYGGAAAQTLRNVAPIGSIAWNRIPSIAERNAVADAVRAARVASGPLETTPQGGGSAGREPTRFSALIRMATAAETAGDSGRADLILRQAEDIKKREGVRNPRAAVMSALNTQSPDIKAFGRRLESSEKSALLGRMGNSARESYVRVDDAVTRLKARTKAPARTKNRSGGMGVASVKVPKVKAPRPPGRGLRIGASRSGGTSRLRMADPLRVGRAPGAGMRRASGLILG